MDACVSQLRHSAAIQHQICCTSYWKAELRKLASLSGFVACNRPFRTVPTIIAHLQLLKTFSRGYCVLARGGLRRDPFPR